MIYEDVELHNVAEVTPVDGGVRFQRVPEWVRDGINESAQFRVLETTNTEIRFVSDSEVTEVVLSSEKQTSVVVYNGCFESNTRRIVGTEPVTLSLKARDRILALDEEHSKDMPFSTKVWRVVCMGGPVILHSVNGKNLRPPQPEELPSVRYLAYGTSITQGSAATGPHLTYAGQAAWHLGADLINLGVAGACHCEKAFADYIAGLPDWNIATLSLSVNMQRFSLEDFHSRVEYMVNTVAGSDTSRPVACITLFPYFRDVGLTQPDFVPGGTPDEYRQILRDIVKACPHPNVHPLEGPELLTNLAGLTTDLIHPSDHGMIEMGWNLAQKLKPLL